MLIIESVVAGLAVTGIVATLRWLYKNIKARQVARANQLAAKEVESQRLAQRRRTRILSPVGINIPQGARVSGPLSSCADPWARTTASGYGSAIRDDLRRKGLTPADYAHGITHRKTK